MSERAPTLVSFGPSGPLPPLHRHCNACGGESEDPPCEVCGGKGYWNASDIAAYHAKYPKACKTSCGNMHRVPDLRPREIIDAEHEACYAQVMELLERADQLLKK